MLASVAPGGQVIGLLGETTLVRYFRDVLGQRPDVEVVAADAEAARFAAVDAALAAGKPVYLTRDLPGAAGRYSLDAAGPLIAVAAEGNARTCPDRTAGRRGHSPGRCPDGGAPSARRPGRPPGAHLGCCATDLGGAEGLGAAGRCGGPGRRDRMTACRYTSPIPPQPGCRASGSWMSTTCRSPRVHLAAISARSSSSTGRPTGVRSAGCSCPPSPFLAEARSRPRDLVLPIVGRGRKSSTFCHAPFRTPVLIFHVE